MAHEGQHQSPLELITQNVRGILADVLNKLECGDVDRSIDFARYRVEWLCLVLVRLGGSLEENLLPLLQEAQQGAIAEYPAARVHKSLATAVPWWMNN